MLGLRPASLRLSSPDTATSPSGPLLPSTLTTSRWGTSPPRAATESAHHSARCPSAAGCRAGAGARALLLLLLLLRLLLGAGEPSTSSPAATASPCCECGACAWACSVAHTGSCLGKGAGSCCSCGALARRSRLAAEHKGEGTGSSQLKKGEQGCAAGWNLHGGDVMRGVAKLGLRQRSRWRAGCAAVAGGGPP